MNEPRTVCVYHFYGMTAIAVILCAAMIMQANAKAVADAKATDRIECKQLVVTSDDGKASITIKQVGTVVGLWANDANGTICIVAGNHLGKESTPFLGVYGTAKETRSGGCPLVITKDAVQLADKDRLKIVSLKSIIDASESLPK